MTHFKCLFLLALCPQLLACDVFDMPEDTAAGETSGDPMRDDDEDADETDDAESMDDESTGGALESSGGESESSEGDAVDVPTGLLGSWIATGGAVASLQLFADGTYVDANRAETMLGTCTTTWELSSSGEFTVVGDVLQLHPTSGHKRVDQCGTVEESNDVPSDSEYVWALGADQFGETLTLTDEYSPIVYHRG